MTWMMKSRWIGSSGGKKQALEKLDPTQAYHKKEAQNVCGIFKPWKKWMMDVYWLKNLALTCGKTIDASGMWQPHGGEVFQFGY